MKFKVGAWYHWHSSTDIKYQCTRIADKNIWFSKTIGIGGTPYSERIASKVWIPIKKSKPNKVTYWE